MVRRDGALGRGGAVVVAREPLLRDGLALIVGDVVDDVRPVESLDELEAILDEVQVVVAHVSDGAEAVELGGLCGARSRAVAVHDGLGPSAVASARRAGVDAFVDTSSGPEVLLGAVVEEGPRGRLRWSPPAVGVRSLSDRELSVLTGVAAGKTSATVAAELGLSVRTVEKYKQQIVERLGARSQAHAVALALQTGIIGPDSSGSDSVVGKGR